MQRDPKRKATTFFARVRHAVPGRRPGRALPRPQPQQGVFPTRRPARTSYPARRWSLKNDCAMPQGKKLPPQMVQSILSPISWFVQAWGSDAAGVLFASASAVTRGHGMAAL